MADNKKGSFCAEISIVDFKIISKGFKVVLNLT